MTTIVTKIREVENKIQDTSSLMTTSVLNTKISEVEKKVPNLDKYITTPEFDKSLAKNFAARLKQANLISKTDFENKLTSFNKKITSNKTKYLEEKKKLNNLTTNDYNFFLRRMYFTSYNGSQKKHLIH